jgi:hypothetical protein
VPSLTRYGFRDAISAYFEFPTETARKILPGHLEPVELHHGTSILAVTVFDFTEAEVGPYGELVMAVVVSPLLKAGDKFPKSAMYPYRVATTTKAAREHAIERWHLPHWMEDVEIDLEREDRRLTAHVKADGAPVLDLAVTDHSFAHVSNLYQSFMKDADGAYLALITIEGTQSEHEDEGGRLQLHDHPFNQEILGADVYDVPFRELWMKQGIQLFQPLIQLETA